MIPQTSAAATPAPSRSHWSCRVWSRIGMKRRSPLRST